MKRFGSIQATAEKFNKANKGPARFYVMTNGKRFPNRSRILTEVGLYDYISKKWALTDVRAHDAAKALGQMENMIAAAQAT